MLAAIAEIHRHCDGRSTVTTYTLAITTPRDGSTELLIATVPDGQDIYAAVRREMDAQQVDDDVEYRTVSGLTLTNDAPEDAARVVWGPSTECGWLIDESNRIWRYAVKETT